MWNFVGPTPESTSVNLMKTLAPEEIECLVGAKHSDLHPLDILGYGFTSEGARRFRAEQPRFLPQIVAYIQSVLVRASIFPEQTNPDDPGIKPFIYADGSSFKISMMVEAGVGRFERICTGPLPETEAIQKYVRTAVNTDYVH